jgi:hypothetical protein
VVEGVANVEIVFLYQWRVRVRLSGKGGWRQWCRSNASVSAREGRGYDESLLEDEAEAVNSS